MNKFLDSTGLLYLWGKIKALLSGKVDKVDGKQLSTNDYTSTEKTKLAGLSNYTHPTGDGNAHVPATGTSNSGKFLRAGSTAGSGAWTALAKADVTTALGYTPPTTDTVYTHPTTAGNKHVPTGGASGQILRWSASGTAVWGAENNTTYAAATASANGWMTSTDKAKLDGFSAASAYALKTEIAGVYKYKGSVATVAALPATGATTGDVYNVEATGMNYGWTGTAWDALGTIVTLEGITNAEIDTVLAS